MGRKDVQPKDSAAVAPSAPEPAPEPEDTPFVKELKVLDDKYLALEREYEKELEKLQAKYDAQQQPLLDERAKKLQNPEGAEKADVGTPALPGFWFTALRNHPAFREFLEEWDEPVLQYLKDITHEPIDPEQRSKGFRLKFHFAPNKYFENSVLSKEYHLEEDSPYTGDVNLTLIKSDEIAWRPGMDVTVHMVAKKVKGGGAKKAKQKKEKQEPRESFFRVFFRTMKQGEPIPEDLKTIFKAMMGGDDQDDSDEDGDEGMMDEVMDQDHDAGSALRDYIIPYAVRWYTGEAAPDDDDDEEGEEEDDDEDEDDEESEEEAKPQRGRGRGGPAAKDKAKKSPAMKPAEDPKECKQQ